MNERAKRPKRGVSDYPPEFREIWELAAKGTLRLEFDARGTAVNFRQRLHAYRKACVDRDGQVPYQHWWTYDLVIKEPTDDTRIWRIVCTELEWKKQVREQAGARLPPPQIEHPSPIIPEMDGEPSKGTAMDAALDKLGFKS